MQERKLNAKQEALKAAEFKMLEILETFDQNFIEISEPRLNQKTIFEKISSSNLCESKVSGDGATSETTIENNLGIFAENSDPKDTFKDWSVDGSESSSTQKSYFDAFKKVFSKGKKVSSSVPKACSAKIGEGGLEINTVSIRTNQNAEKPHLVMIHGWGAGLGIWIKQMQDLSKDYQVHCVDLLGWGRSSRPKFADSLSATEVASIWVESIESWRKVMKIDKFTLVGHSMGGYLSASYALQHGHSTLDKLVLLSPIGINGFDLSHQAKARPLFTRLLVTSIWSFTPQRLLSLLPAQRVRKRLSNARLSLTRLFPYKINEEDLDQNVVMEYVYRLATTGPVSGEIGFTKLMDVNKGWKLPVKDRLFALATANQNDRSKFPILFVYGAHDWIDPSWAVKEMGENARLGDRAKVFILKNSGHHGYIEDFEHFNEIVLNGEYLGNHSSELNRPITSLEELGKWRDLNKPSLKIS